MIASTDGFYQQLPLLNSAFAFESLLVESDPSTEKKWIFDFFDSVVGEVQRLQGLDVGDGNKWDFTHQIVGQV